MRISDWSSDVCSSDLWYATTRETGKTVPTWNYVAIHAYGTLQLFDEPERLRTVVARHTVVQEATRPEPWTMGTAPEDYIQAQLKGIVGRSEERSGGKGCVSTGRYRGSPEHIKKRQKQK